MNGCAKMVGQRRGETAPWAKLSQSDIASIRAAYPYSPGKGGRIDNAPTMRATADRYGISPSTLSAVVAMRTWRNVPDEEHPDATAQK